MSRYYRSILNVQAVAPIVLDPDAEAFLTAAGITDATITDAINDLVISLKDDGLWSKMIAIYPFVVGTASTHKFNLKDPRDSDAAFRLTFVGSPTHSANGIQGNGSSQYARTHLIPFVSLAQNNASGFCYSNLTGDGLDFGCQTGAGTHGIQIGSFLGDFFTRCNNTTASITSATDLTGFFGVSRLASGSFTENRNGAITTRSIASTGLSNVEIHLMAYNNGGSPVLLSNKRYAFYATGEGLDSTEQGNLKNIVDTFQTALSRA